MHFVGAERVGFRVVRTTKSPSQVDTRLLGEQKSNSHGARPALRIISMIKWIWTNRSSIMNSFSRRVVKPNKNRVVKK